jgi:FlaA1/EpsC-like NDP-sugar epimerase
MGASKRIMEMYLMPKSKNICISTARFANVAFSDGSLLYGFNQRIQKHQPIVAPNNIKRYFVTAKESGELCLMSCILGENRDIFFPKLSEDLHLVRLTDVAIKYVEALGYQPYLCKNEEEARDLIKVLPTKGQWPCLFESSNTTGEKDFEEFYTGKEELDMEHFQQIGVIKNHLNFDEKKLNYFKEHIYTLKDKKSWNKKDILDLFLKLIPDFEHKETGIYLDSKM